VVPKGAHAAVRQAGNLCLERFAGTLRGRAIIFKDFGTSNWSWDPVANILLAPLLCPTGSFDNPIVHETVKTVLDFW
jgi:hypothetical protein